MATAFTSVEWVVDCKRNSATDQTTYQQRFNAANMPRDAADDLADALEKKGYIEVVVYLDEVRP